MQTSSTTGYPASVPELPPDDRLVPTDTAAEMIGRSKGTLERWIRLGYLTPYKKRRDRRTHVDVAELPEALRKAGRPGPKPRPRGRDAEDQ